MEEKSIYERAEEMKKYQDYNFSLKFIKEWDAVTKMIMRGKGGRKK